MIFRGRSRGAGFERVIDEKRDLESRLDSLTSASADLERRLHQLESSTIFRFLRWLGQRLAWSGVPLFKGLQPLSSPVAAQEYAELAQDGVLFRRALSQLRAKSAETAPETRVSFLIEAPDLDQPAFERTIQSIAAQEHREWELFVATKGEPPAWLETALSVHTAGHRVGIFAEDDLQQSLQLALEKCTGEFVAVLTGNAILEPDALHQFIPAAAHDAIAVYSDWDHVDSAGRFHSPRFTPELSPELLRHASYWGQCYLVRTASLRRMDIQEDTALPDPLYDLPLRLAQMDQPVRRIPQVLWHAQAHTPLIGAVRVSAPLPPSGRVSVIVCSNNPRKLAQSLEVVLPTLSRRHELIVVAHGHGGNGRALEQIAASRQVRSIRYDGPFHFGLMNHLGVARSSGDLLCLLNDDVHPVTPDWLERMEAQAERPDVGVAGALLLYPDRTIQHAGVVIGDGLLPTHIGRALLESSYWPWLRMTREVTAVTGACAVLRRDVWDELGGFDLRFPASYNDIDLCLRAGARGYRILIEAEAVLIHEESQSRNPVVLPEESSLFRQLWGHLVLSPDRFFNPQLELRQAFIGLRNARPVPSHAEISAAAQVEPASSSKAGVG